MPHFDRAVYIERMERARAGLAAAERSCAIIHPSADLEYLTGLDVHPSERLIALLLPERGEARIVCPAFEEGRILEGGVIEKTLPWREQDDPFEILARDGEVHGSICLGAAMPFFFVDRIRRALPAADLASADPIIAPLRMVKGPEEVAAQREALERTRERIFDAARTARDGVMEAEIARSLDGGIVLFSENGALPHGVAGKRKLTAEDSILIDAGERVRGYWSDITRTFIRAGNEKANEIHRIVADAQTAAFRKAGPGVQAQEVDRAARASIAQAGYERFFTHRTGHGIGLQGHEPPFLVEGNVSRLEPGMTMTIEPGIYLPGEFGVRIEDVFLITEDGCEPLSQRDLSPTHRA
ncbi:MAG: Xaa-Pro peptidase family protein [Planctomycetota bacterium]|nr:Xaa-Pro peptidase family protein [Planctomycetota bacterium]